LNSNIIYKIIYITARSLSCLLQNTRFCTRFLLRLYMKRVLRFLPSLTESVHCSLSKNNFLLPALLSFHIEWRQNLFFARDKGGQVFYFKLLIVSGLSLGLFSAHAVCAGQIYLLHLKNGRTMKCKNIKEQGSVVLCDADGLMLTIGRTTVDRIATAEGRLTKRSPQVGSRVGGSSRYSRGSSNSVGGSSIKVYCSNEWGTDYRMVEYCIKNQTEALSKLNRHSGPIRNDCEKKWGADYRMVVYCIEQQTQAKRNIDSMR
jgi:hypothetical protein